MATAAAAGVPQRAHTANVYKPAGAKPVQLNVAWADGGATVLSSKVDLDLPARGLRVKLAGRLVLGVADITTPSPEGFLNLLSRIKVEGVNSRVNGNTTLYDIDLATLWGIQHLFTHRAGTFVINGTHVPIPGTPFPTPGAAGYINPAQGTYDFSVVVDLPFHPFQAPSGIIPGYCVRSQEWGDSLTVSLGFGHQAAGAVAGMLGTPAAGTTSTFTAFGSAGGTPTVDVYVLPIQMGSLKDSVVPGICSRVTRPLSQILQAAGAGISLVSLQKARTSRVYIKTGTATAPPAFATLNDTNLTAVGLSSAGNTKQIKPLADVAILKANQPVDYHRECVQGYTCLDFLQSGNPDSSFAGQSKRVIGEGTTFDLVGNVAGLANAYGIVVQEMITHLHSGQLYNF